ncbi:autotransporter-associated beta strand repeat-containing protein, partial [Luteolibacter marinus]|uniref:autotransporter-associated beta strand repeat-containing protein n=1 Tax=Luteolibacter marinus TaxID=2776705 RepID=UPI0018689889
MKMTSTGALTRASLLASAAFCAVTSVQAQSGTWTGTTNFDTWGNTANWDAATVADGAGNTADFSTIDLPEGGLVLGLEASRTIGNLTFGDIDTATVGSWVIDDNLDPLNILTLAGTPEITVNALAADEETEISLAVAVAELAMQVAGTDGLTKSGPGTLILSGPNSYSGTTTLNAGTLAINSATAIGSGPLTIAGGTIDSGTGTILSTNNLQNWNDDFTFLGTSNLNLGTGAVTAGAIRDVNTVAGVLTVGGAITAPGLTKSGAGELALNGDSSATLIGPILLKEGTVRLGGGAGNGQKSIGATTNTLTFEGGTLVLNGATGSANYTDGLATPIFIDAGQTGTIYNTQRTGTDFTAPLSGSGTLNFVVRYVRGEMNANWSAFTGNINVTSATAPAFSDLRIKTTNLFTNAKLHIGPSVYASQIFNPPSGSGTQTVQPIGELSGDAGAVLAGNPVSGRFVNWTIGSLNTDSEFAGDIVNSAGAARVTKNGTGTLTLSGNNTYTGETAVNAGTLQIGNGGATGVLGATNVTVAGGASLVFNRDNSGESTYPGILAGAGSVIKRGSGQVNFNGVNTYTAGTTIEGGTIGINNAASLGAAGTVSFTTANGGIRSNAAGVTSAQNFDIAG